MAVTARRLDSRHPSQYPEAHGPSVPRARLGGPCNVRPTRLSRRAERPATQPSESQRARSDHPTSQHRGPSSRARPSALHRATASARVPIPTQARASATGGCGTGQHISPSDKPDILAQAPRVHIVTDVPPTPSKYPRNNEVCCPSLGFFFMCFTLRIFPPFIISLHNVCRIIMHILCIIIMHKLCIIIVQMHNLISLHNPAGGAIFRKRTASGGRS